MKIPLGVENLQKAAAIAMDRAERYAKKRQFRLARERAVDARMLIGQMRAIENGRSG